MCFFVILGGWGCFLSVFLVIAACFFRSGFCFPTVFFVVCFPWEDPQVRGRAVTIDRDRKLNRNLVFVLVFLVVI